MTPEEAVLISRLVKAACPSQKFDEYTPDVWAPMLADIDYGAAEKAIVEIGKRQKWIAPSDIIAEVRRASRPAVPYHRPIREVLAGIDAQIEAERAAAKAIES